jgi:hypothetical protein
VNEPTRRNEPPTAIELHAVLGEMLTLLARLAELDTAEAAGGAA